MNVVVQTFKEHLKCLQMFAYMRTLSKHHEHCMNVRKYVKQ